MYIYICLSIVLFGWWVSLRVILNPTEDNDIDDVDDDEDEPNRRGFDDVVAWIRCRLWNATWRVTLWLFNIAIEHGPFIVDLPIQNGDFP